MPFCASVFFSTDFLAGCRPLCADTFDCGTRDAVNNTAMRAAASPVLATIGDFIKPPGRLNRAGSPSTLLVKSYQSTSDNKTSAVCPLVWMHRWLYLLCIAYSSL